ncbi:MAG: hypothetical protein K2W96_02805 [Gemmataceae bacterium]|nr:hypothetical protein [Gemmataceae bacterium]
MALEEFWNSVRHAARLLSGKVFETRPFTLDDIERTLRGTAVEWAVPRTVAAFDEADFAFLPDADRARLAALVAEFKRLAPRLSPIAKPTPEQAEPLVPILRDIVALLRFDLYGTAEGLRLGKRIEAGLAEWRPPELVELRFSTGTNWLGEPLLSILGLIDKPDHDSFLDRLKTIDPLVIAVARETAPGWFLHPMFHLVSEQYEPVEA